MTRCKRSRELPTVHELSVCRALLAEVERIAVERSAHGVQAIHVQIGVLSGVESALLETAWPSASAGSLAENAHLVIERMPLRVRCLDCGAESETAPSRLLCGACGSLHTHLISGDELLLVSLELICTAPDLPDSGSPNGELKEA